MTPVRTWFALVGGIVLALVSSRPALAQQLGQGDDDGIAIWRIAAVVVIVLAIGAAAIFVVKGRLLNLRVWVPAADRRIRIVETVRMSTQSTLCLATLDGREYLIAVTPGNASVIAVQAVAVDT